MNMTFSSSNGLSALLGISWLFPALLAVQFLVTLWLAIAVKKDADLRAHSRDGVFLGSPWLWFAVVLVSGGYLATLAYWVIHYSSFLHRRDQRG